MENAYPVNPKRQIRLAEYRLLCVPSLAGVRPVHLATMFIFMILQAKTICCKTSLVALTLASDLHFRFQSPLCCWAFNCIGATAGRLRTVEGEPNVVSMDKTRFRVCGHVGHGAFFRLGVRVRTDPHWSFLGTHRPISATSDYA